MLIVAVPVMSCYKHINNPHARNEVLKMITELDLFDVYRCENNDKRAFTWRKKSKNKEIQMGRLDFFLLSQSLLNYSTKEKIHPSYRSDHNMISLCLK